MVKWPSEKVSKPEYWKKEEEEEEEEGRNFQLLQIEKNRKVQLFLLYIYKTFSNNEEDNQKARSLMISVVLS